MPVGKVRHVGDIVAMVIASTLDQARDAAELLAIDYDELPAVITVAQALAPGAPRVHDELPDNLLCKWQRGDAAATDAAFADAAHITRLSIRSPRQVTHFIETRCAWSTYDSAEDVVTVTFSSQGVQLVHRVMCDSVLKLPKDKLRLVTEDVGGGFGPKLPISPESSLIAWATRKLGRSLRWACERAGPFAVRQPCARPRGDGRARPRQARPLRRPARDGPVELRRLCLDGGAHDFDHPASPK